MEEIVARRKKSELSFTEIKKNLLRRFLYRGDGDAIQILLNIYNVEEKVENIFPNYMSIKALRKDIVSFLKGRDEREMIASNLSQIIHDDVNRFELVIYLFAYRKGLEALQLANELEILTFNSFSVEDLYNKNILYHYESENTEVLSFKEEVLREIQNSKALKKNLLDLIYWYNRKVMKSKIYSLNRHLDRQISIDTDSKQLSFIEIENNLSLRELRGLNKKLIHFLYRDGLRIWETAYWNGINDLVLRRYDS